MPSNVRPSLSLARSALRPLSCALFAVSLAACSAAPEEETDNGGAAVTGAEAKQLQLTTVTCKSGAWSRPIEVDSTAAQQRFRVALQPNTTFEIRMGTLWGSMTAEAFLVDKNGDAAPAGHKVTSTKYDDPGGDVTNTASTSRTWEIVMSRSVAAAASSWFAECLPIVTAPTPSGTRDKARCRTGAACTLTTPTGTKSGTCNDQTPLQEHLGEPTKTGWCD